MRRALVLGALLLSVMADAAEKRSPAQVAAFRRAHPCPVTGRVKGPCPGYVVDHAYPLCAGGVDAPTNMVWQDVRGSYAKDRLERELCAYRAKDAVRTR